MEKDCGTTGTGLGLGTRMPLPPGRITGSASIETLVRVGIEKENGLSPDSKMVIVHDFTPCVDDELQVKKGQVSDYDSQNCSSMALCIHLIFCLREKLYNSKQQKIIRKK